MSVTVSEFDVIKLALCGVLNCRCAFVQHGSERACTRVLGCGRSEWSALIFFFFVPMSVIDGRTVSLTSLIPDWLTNLGLIEANSICNELSLSAIRLHNSSRACVDSTTITQHGECSF